MSRRREARRVPVDAKRPYPAAVLMYHDVVDSADSVPASHRPYVVTADIFRDQLRLMHDAGYPGVSLAAHLAPDAAPQPPTCVITFDDGHESNLTHALPQLLAQRFTATFFITVGWLGKRPYLSWSQLRELVDAGMEVGSHSMTHRPPAGLTVDQLRSEMRDSKRLLEDRLGIEILTASSPTGFYNPAIIDAAREAGYRGLCFGRVALWDGPAAPFPIPRLAVKRDSGLELVRRMICRDRRMIAALRRRQSMRDGLKRWLGVDRYLRFRRFVLRLDNRLR